MARSSTCWCSPKRAGLPEHGVDQGGLAVVDVGDDRDVAQVVAGARGHACRLDPVSDERGIRPQSTRSARRGQTASRRRTIGTSAGSHVDVEPLARPQQAQRVVVLDRGRDAPDDAHPPHPHPVRRRHRPAVAVRPRHLRADLHLDAQLLRELAVQRLQRRLPRLDLAARQFPPSRQTRWLGPAGGEERRGALQVVEHRGADDEHQAGLCAHAGSVPHPGPDRRPRPHRRSPRPQGRPGSADGRLAS